MIGSNRFGLPRGPRPYGLAAGLLACLLGAAAAPRAWGADPLLFRPAMADPYESIVRIRVNAFTEDLRYGSDITDSTSRGGWERGLKGVGFDLEGGKTFRAPILEHLFGWRVPARAYQLTASALTTTSIDRIQLRYLTVVDYQVGFALEAQWTGEADRSRGVRSFRRPVVTSRLGVYHRSSHIGDEYVTQSPFGSNQPGVLPTTGPLAHPPPRRTKLSYEFYQPMAALEWAPRGGGATVRLYGGGEFKTLVGTRRPHNLTAPVGLLGAEWRSAGAREALPAGAISRWLTRRIGAEPLATAWFAAAHLRLERPFLFATCDDPNGQTEVWTPNLWTNCDCGRQAGAYAGTWRAQVGLLLHRVRERDGSAAGKLAGGETALTLEWSRGYSEHAQLLDIPRHTHPRWLVLPGLTMHF